MYPTTLCGLMFCRGCFQKGVAAVMTKTKPAHTEMQGRADESTRTQSKQYKQRPKHSRGEEGEMQEVRISPLWSSQDSVARPCGSEKYNARDGLGPSVGQMTPNKMVA
ncbi:hypothetical protein C8R44DRAFT_737446 [Mycena epipterygia]|nr:hypothetical protein C8R44DRAFT_737446 [Mycena epipterygia]